MGFKKLYFHILLFTQIIQFELIRNQDIPCNLTTIDKL